MKGEIGRISKQILTSILTKVRAETKLNQMENVYSVIKWFKELKNKESMSFIIFDVVNYYPSISPKLLTKSIKWASQFIDISKKQENIIMKSKKSLLFSNGEFWLKKGSTQHCHKI